MTDWEKLRKEQWPVLETMTFLDAACVSFAPQKTVQALKEFADFTARQDEENSSAHHIAMDRKRQKAYLEGCRLLNADPEEVAVVESTSHGLNIAANAIELTHGDNIVTTNLEFIQVALPWCMLRKEKNFEIRVLKTPDSSFHVDDFKKICDEHTRIVVISSVEWCNGWRMNLKEIGEFCESKGIFLVVDAVQELGVCNIDTKEIHVDLLAAGGHKWLNSPFGSGILYINKNTIPLLQQTYFGYLNTKEPKDGWGAYWENPKAPSVNDWEFDMTARKFEIGGTSNYVGTIALGETLELVNSIGIDNIEKRVHQLSTYCMDQIEKICGTLITNRTNGRYAGIVIARFFENLAIERRILANLHKKRVYVAMRFTDDVGGFRISCHYFNNERDIDALVRALSEEINKIGRKPDYKRPW